MKLVSKARSKNLHRLQVAKLAPPSAACELEVLDEQIDSVQLFGDLEMASKTMIKLGAPEEAPGLCMIIMERGAGWPVFAADIQRGGQGALVELQADEESYRQFAERVRRRFRSVRQSGQPVRSVILAASSETVGTDTLRRQELATKIVRALGSSGTLFLTAQCRPNEDVRDELLELAGLLCEQSQLNVSVRFSEPHDSGVHWSVRGASIPPAPKAPRFSETELREAMG